jgi:hypothetical protein
VSGPSLPVIDNGLPGINRPLDNTALSAYMACPREYYMSMVLHRRGEGRSAALAYGSMMHILLENHYKTGGAVSIVEALGRSWWQENGHHEEGDHRTVERAILDYKRYREKWGQKPEEEQGRTVGYPDEPMVEIAADVKAGSLVHPYAVKLDRVIELGGLHYIEDHKTTSRLDRNYYGGFELSNQMMGYTRIGQLLMPSLKIVGIRLNVIHVLKDKTNFERQLFTFTKEQMAEWEANTNRWMERLSADAQGWPSDEELFSGAAQDRWPLAHFGNGCSRKFGLCQYHSVCTIATPFRHRRLAEYPVNVWNPLEVDD